MEIIHVSSEIELGVHLCTDVRFQLFRVLGEMGKKYELSSM